MKRHKSGLAWAVVAAAVLAGCGTDGPRPTDDTGSVTFDLSLAPPEARCAAVTATPTAGAPVVKRFELGPGQSTSFALSGLPTGAVTLVQDVFTWSCASGVEIGAAWTSTPVMVTLVAGVSVDVTFVLHPTAAGGQVNAQSNFTGKGTPPAMSEIVTPAMGDPFQIATGPDGNLWFTEKGTDQIGRMTPAGVLTEFAVPTMGAQPSAITAGPDGALWFTQAGAPKIGRITVSGAIREFNIPSGNSALSIASGPDGNVWFTELHKLGRISPSGAITLITVPGDLANITAGSDGSIWFTADAPAYVGRYVPATARLTPFRTFGYVPQAITAGPDGALWFTATGGRIGRIGVDGVIGTFTLAPLAQGATFISSGPDGALWFTDGAAGAIGRISTGGTITSYLTPSTSTPHGITWGPDGALWYTDLQERLGRVRPQ